MNRNWIITGLVCIILAIILGAFGAHGLQRLTQDPKILMAFDTATKYQFFQGLGFLLVPSIADRFHLKGKNFFAVFLLGTCLFSGSIYLLSIAKISGIEWMRVAMIPLTPIGGVFLILGWTLLLFRILKTK